MKTTNSSLASQFQRMNTTPAHVRGRTARPAADRGTRRRSHHLPQPGKGSRGDLHCKYGWLERDGIHPAGDDLVHAAAAQRRARLEPDGQHIVFLSNRTGQWKCWVMNPDGSGQRQLPVDVSIEYNGVYSVGARHRGRPVGFPEANRS